MNSTFTPYDGPRAGSYTLASSPATPVVVQAGGMATVEVVQVHMGLSGTGSTDVDALHITQRLAEFATPIAKSQARANLELEDIDCGTFN